jgi:hypothetical protein
MNSVDNAPEMYPILVGIAKQFYWRPSEPHWGGPGHDTFYVFFKRNGILTRQQVLVVIRNKFVWLPGPGKDTDSPCNIYVPEGTEQIEEFFSKGTTYTRLANTLWFIHIFLACLGPLWTVFALCGIMVANKNTTRLNESRPRTTIKAPTSPGQ